MPPDVSVRDLVKHYVVPERAGGLRASLRSVVRRRHRLVRAVDGISFEVNRGEVVGFLGPNGAGKTTALKVLSGLLHPTDGQVDVLGFTPWDRRAEYLSQITLIMGQRQQLFWDLPAIDSFLVNKAVFGIDDAVYKRTVDLLTSLLDLGDLLTKPVRQLSLGERMKVELAAGLLHGPRVLFLDEPTIGLDVTMQQRIREFITTYNDETGATVLLTSHYMADVKALARRVIVIDKGHAALRRRSGRPRPALRPPQDHHRPPRTPGGPAGPERSGRSPQRRRSPGHGPRRQGRRPGSHRPPARPAAHRRSQRRGPAARGSHRPGVPR